MRAVVFIKDYRDESTLRYYKAGVLLQMEDADAERLEKLGVVRVRQPHEPTETKGG